LGIWKLFIIVFTNTPLNVGSYTGLIMIVGIISENAILPIYSLKRHLLVRMIKAIALCNLNAFKTEIDDCFRCHYCIITFSDWNRYGSELHQPLAIAVIGVLIAMPLLLIVLPSLLYYFNIEQKSS
jgi:multidrug efflux pump subunit AcrB